MDNFKDIYGYFYYGDIENNFYKLDCNKQKDVVDSMLKKYLKEKIEKKCVSYKFTKDETVYDLVEIALKFYDEEVLSDLVHAILNIISNIQGYGIVWYCEEQLTDATVVLEMKENKWDYLRTSKYISMVEIFKYVYDKYQKDFFVGKSFNDIGDKFLRYVSIPTNSNSYSELVPSSLNQMFLAQTLKIDLDNIGVDECLLDKNGCVYAKINGDKDIPSIGFIAHIDTSEDAKDDFINPLVIQDYDGNDVVYKDKTILEVSENPDLLNHVGKTLITTDGNTLLGADDKAGIAEIMGMLEYYKYTDEPHGDIYVAFTPDEEIGKSVDYLDRNIFNPKYAYTVDGEYLGEISYDNFNAADVDIYINGLNVHPGYAKNKMINAVLIANTINSLLPKREIPAKTEGYEGFYHLHKMNGTVSEASMLYLIRDFDKDNFETRINILKSIVEKLNKRYGNCIEINVNIRYKNMRKIIEKNIEIVEIAKRAIEKEGVQPYVKPIRGGTDGTRLSFEGIPCPNLGTGGHNFHSIQEYIALEDMEKIKDILIGIVREHYLSYKKEDELIKSKRNN